MLRISLSNPLPLRPRGLAAEDLAKVFGGCNESGGSCEKDSDCCQPQGNYTAGCSTSTKKCFTISTSF